MVDAVDRSLWNISELLGVVVGLVVLKNGDDLIVGLSAIDHAESTDRSSIHDDVAVQYWSRGEDTDVHRVAVANDILLAGRFGAEFGDAVTAQGTGDEAVEGWAVVRELLWAVEAKDAGLFVDLKLHGVGRNDLDVAGNENWSVGAGGDAVPWVRAELLRSVFHRGTMIGVLRDKIKELAVDFRRQELIPRQK